MKKHFFITAIISLLAIGLVGLPVWHNVIQPKNTRLAFYELLLASKKPLQFKEGQVSIWVDNLNDMKPKHLKLCEQIQYHNTKLRLEIFLETKSDDAIIVPTTLPFSTSLQRVARRYTGELPSLEALSEIGETEFSNVMAEISSFEAELLKSKYTGSLNELATQPKDMSSNPQEIEEIYKRFIAEGERSLSSRFYEYNIPKGTAEIVEKPQKWSSYASYHPTNNSMIAYFDEAIFDTNIARFISVHEIFPGHHLNLKARLSNPLCPGDRVGGLKWLGEGWATYAEFIADEEGFFEQPEHKLAWLDYRLIRAMRIILDIKKTQGVFEYDELKLAWEERMPERLAGRFDREFNRINSSHHQHLSYILGYKEIMDSKAKLTQELGDNFDEKKFHDAILRLDHKYPKALYETVRVAMQLSSENFNIDINTTEK